jgi:hypothetical protein
MVWKEYRIDRRSVNYRHIPLGTTISNRAPLPGSPVSPASVGLLSPIGPSFPSSNVPSLLQRFYPYSGNNMPSFAIYPDQDAFNYGHHFRSHLGVAGRIDWFRPVSRERLYYVGG